MVGRVVAVRAAGQGGGEGAGPWRLERGRVTVSIVIEGLPVGDLPAGARLRIGETAVVALGAPEAGGSPRSLRTADPPAGVLEAGETAVVPAAVLEPGLVEPGDGVRLEAVALPLTDVLDLHSFRPEETQKVVTEYLDGARRAGLDEVRIVHGRGRGVQRALVRRVLSGAPGVAGFTEAPPARGGWGATVVRLRRTGDAPSA
jgi:hypothetical protein